MNLSSPPLHPLAKTNLGSFSSILFQALVVYECLSEWGPILCAICPNLKLVITGGTSTAICVWETGTSKERAKSLTLKQVKKTHKLFPRNPTQGPEVAPIPRALTKYLILKKSKLQECTV